MHVTSFLSNAILVVDVNSNDVPNITATSKAGPVVAAASNVSHAATPSSISALVLLLLDQEHCLSLLRLRKEHMSFPPHQTIWQLSFLRNQGPQDKKPPQEVTIKMVLENGLSPVPLRLTLRSRESQFIFNDTRQKLAMKQPLLEIKNDLCQSSSCCASSTCVDFCQCGACCRSNTLVPILNAA